MTSDMEEILSGYISKDILKRPNYPLGSADPLITSGLIDSFHLVDLALFVEDRFGVKVDDTELNAETFDTLAELANLIQQRMG